MPLHEQAKQFLQDISTLPASHTIEPAELRAMVAGTIMSETYALESTEDVELPGPHGPLTLRIYRPLKDQLLPVIVFYHGGGFVLCDIDKYDPLCRKLAAMTGCAVVSVGYRLAPEYKFPVAVEEAVFAAEWVYANCAALGFDPARLIAAGDSAGGNLAAVVAQSARQSGRLNIAAQLLICPLTDWNGDYESRRQFASGYFLDAEIMDYFARHYLRGDADRLNPLASPALGDVTGLPPALIITAECDLLRDEGEAYGHRLVQAGVRTTIKRYPGMIHGFYAMTDLFTDAHGVYEEIRRELESLVCVDKS